MAQVNTSVSWNVKYSINKNFSCKEAKVALLKLPLAAFSHLPVAYWKSFLIEEQRD